MHFERRSSTSTHSNHHCANLIMDSNIEKAGNRLKDLCLIFNIPDPTLAQGMVKVNHLCLLNRITEI